MYTKTAGVAVIRGPLCPEQKHPLVRTKIFCPRLGSAFDLEDSDFL